jgi:hypothetical protein
MITNSGISRQGSSTQGSVSDNPVASGGGLVVAGRLRIRDRIAARWRARRLDFALAGGTPTEGSTALALRARRLTALSRRRSIADALRRVVREGREGARFSAIRIIPYRARVTAASEELIVLADALADPRPVAAHGVAQAWILLTDGTGPLYNPSHSASLPERAAAAAGALRLEAS